MAESVPSSPAITDDVIDRLRRRIGIPVKRLDRPHTTVVSSDSIREFAIAQGDDNPLYVDDEYGVTTRWGAQLAPPLCLMTTGVRLPYAYQEGELEALSGGDPLRGIGQYLSSESWQLLAPVHPGVRLFRSRHLHEVEERQSSFGGSRVAVVTYRIHFTDAEQRLYAINDRTYHHVARDQSAQRGKHRDTELQRYTDDEIAVIDEQYDLEWRRGREKLLPADLQIDAELPSIVKGPLTVTDIIFYHVGIGMGGSDGPLRLARTTRARVPGWFTRNGRNVPDVVQRCHWEDDFAQGLGQPGAYDYGGMRTNWMAHLITNWMGDDAWISHLSAEVKRFNYLGDTHWMRGRISAVHRNTSVPSVDIAIEGVNQRDETTCTGRATVLLCRDDGTSPTLSVTLLNAGVVGCECVNERPAYAQQIRPSAPADQVNMSISKDING